MSINLSSSPPSSFSLLGFTNSRTPISDYSLRSKTHVSKSIPSSVHDPFSPSRCNPLCKNLPISRKVVHSIGRRRGSKICAVAGLNFGGLQGAQSVIEAASVLTAIIVVHETGHFLAAYLQGIRVSKFAIGFGPVLAKFFLNNVEYSIRAFPLGGFVGFPDNDPDSDIPVDDVDLLKNRPIFDRVLVVSAGVIANIMFAYVIIVVQVLSVGFPVQDAFPGVLVPEVRPSSAAFRDGLLPGDIILSVNGIQLPKGGPNSVSEVVDVIKRNPKRNVVLDIARGDQDFKIRVTPDENTDGSGRIGVQLSPNVKFTKVKPKDILETLNYSGREFWGLTSNVLDSLKQTFLNFSQSASKVSGPVAIIAVGAEVAKSDSDGLYQFAALLNLNLAVINLLPLPALDGGSLALILVEAARGGRKLPLEVEQGIMSSGVMFVIMLGLFLIIRDTLNLDIVKDML